MTVPATPENPHMIKVTIDIPHADPRAYAEIFVRALSGVPPFPENLLDDFRNGTKDFPGGNTVPAVGKAILEAHNAALHVDGVTGGQDHTGSPSFQITDTITSGKGPKGIA